MGILTDRFGGRAIFSILMAVVALPVWFVPQQATYSGLLTVAFLLGLAGSSFAIGVGYVSRWTPAERQGSALGVYGLGNIGQSAAVFLGPVLAAQVGMPAVYQGVAVLLVVWAAAFALLARNAPAGRPLGQAQQRKGLGAMLEGAHPRKALVAPGGLLLPDLRRLCRVLHLSAHAAEGRIPSAAHRRRFPHR
jgi:nitrate/nitrite transporter NarK